MYFEKIDKILSNVGFLLMCYCHFIYMKIADFINDLDEVSFVSISPKTMDTGTQCDPVPFEAGFKIETIEPVREPHNDCIHNFRRVTVGYDDYMNVCNICDYETPR